MTLDIDTTDNLKTKINLGDTTFTKTYQDPRQQDVMGALVQAFKKTNSSSSSISDIKVNPGPGSFTGLRVGLSIANTLSFALEIPINGKPLGSFIKPIYHKPPSITSPHSFPSQS